jgi:dTDP-4-amino-4,6-dideoxygalactose transaminase
MTPTWLRLSDPDITQAELEAVSEVLQSPQLSGGPMAQAFEEAFAKYIGREHAVAVASGTFGLLLALKASGIEPKDEVIASPYSWREAARGALLVRRSSPTSTTGGTLVPRRRGPLSEDARS